VPEIVVYGSGTVTVGPLITSNVTVPVAPRPLKVIEYEPRGQPLSGFSIAPDAAPNSPVTGCCMVTTVLPFRRYVAVTVRRSPLVKCS
jgi:hypothetical protein